MEAPFVTASNLVNRILSNRSLANRTTVSRVLAKTPAKQEPVRKPPAAVRPQVSKVPNRRMLQLLLTMLPLEKLMRSSLFHKLPGLVGNKLLASHATPEGNRAFFQEIAKDALPRDIERPEIPLKDQLHKNPISSDFERAVKQHLGKSYQKLDCYELVIQGIKDLGFRYQGPGGIKDTLLQMAEKQGLPQNAYLTGKGLLAAIGTGIYSNSFTQLKNPRLQAEQCYERLLPFLKQGYLLSFSTPTRGHLGVISRHENQWTFVNSGKMDHNLKGQNSVHAVGEEDLRREVQNWFRYAANRKEPLHIQLGGLDDQKIDTFVRPGSRLRTSA